MKWWNPRRDKVECETHQKAKYVGIWWNEQWNDETLGGLSKSVKLTKCPSALAYDEKNIHVKRFE